MIKRFAVTRIRTWYKTYTSCQMNFCLKNVIIIFVFCFSTNIFAIIIVKYEKSSAGNGQFILFMLEQMLVLCIHMRIDAAIY
ncbi:hypothetical protein T10_6609 [Trichinella papuae]|uniref:Uncharacterized protein n=1 Tax=Trichinella papuae TaxID=268474 RepID=A0A0V1MK26_9BILA|nr:hypothetical protein T10_6609 [Trichinella papuae]